MRVVRKDGPFFCMESGSPVVGAGRHRMPKVNKVALYNKRSYNFHSIETALSGVYFEYGGKNETTYIRSY